MGSIQSPAVSEIPKWKSVYRCAISDGVPRRSFYVAIIVGTILTLINQGGAILGAGSINWLKVILTYFIPYAVCTYGAVYAQTMHVNASNTGEEKSWPS